jgi:hypothetical protein
MVVGYPSPGRLRAQIDYLPLAWHTDAERSRMKTTTFLLICPAFCLSLGACARMPRISRAEACANGLDRAFAELNDVEASGFSGTVSCVKAASLLSAAKVQQQFEKYPNCIDKVHRAREYIRMARRGVRSSIPQARRQRCRGICCILAARDV